MISLNSRDASIYTMKLRENMHIGSMYAVFLFSVSMLMKLFSDMGYSSVLTYGAAVQTFGFYTLYQRVQRHKSLAGVSKKTVELLLLYLVLRCLCTLTRGGYLPVDRSGDWLYQSLDMASLALVLALRCAFEDPTLRRTYQEDFDSFNVVNMLPACIVLAVFIHGNLNDSFFWDSLWTASMNIDTVAMLPQLWMLSRIGGEVKGMTAHFVVAIMVSRALAFSFWMYGYTELGFKKRGRGINLAGYQLVGAHMLACLFSADFVAQYAMARLQGKKMELPGLA